jgi:hypothetical protein
MPRKFLIDDEILKGKVDAGKTFPEIMKELACSRATLDRNLKRLNLKAADGRAFRYKKATKKLSPGKQQQDSSSEDSYLKHVRDAKSHVKIKGFKHPDNPNIDVVIAVVDAQIEEYKKRLDKLNQVKQILAA